MALTIEHTDTCLACYLTDHHNRPGELLLGIPCNGQDETYAAEELIDELNAADWGLPESFDYRAFDAEARAAGVGVDLTSDDPADSDDGGDMCMAWFLVRYS